MYNDSATYELLMECKQLIYFEIDKGFRKSVWTTYFAQLWCLYFHVYIYCFVYKTYLSKN